MMDIVKDIKIFEIVNINIIDQKLFSILEKNN